MLHLNSASSSHKDQVGVITLISYYFKIESVKVSFSHASDSVWYYLYWSARHKGRADLLTLRCNWNNQAWTDLNMDVSSEADPSEKIWFAWWNHQEKLLQCVHSVHVCCFECMKIISKLFLKKLFLVHNIPFTAEITFLRTGVVGFLDESADTSFASGSSFPGQVKVWFTTGVWFRSEVTVPDTWSAARLMSVPLNGPAALKVFVKQTGTRCKATLLAAAGRALRHKAQARPSRAEQTLKFPVIRSPAADSCYRGDCCWPWRLEVGMQTWPTWKQIPLLLKCSTLGGCTWVASYLCAFLMNAEVLFLFVKWLHPIMDIPLPLWHLILVE